jgi:hypothetical protein
MTFSVEVQSRPQKRESPAIAGFFMVARGLQLDFLNPENAEVFEWGVPFDEEIAVGWK